MRTVAFVFGRMNPVTSGHMKLIETLANQPADNHFVYLSHTMDSKKNPLSYEQKLAYVKKAAEYIPEVDVVESSAKTAIDVLKEFSGNYDKVIFVAGSDRVADFEALFNAYNGKPDKKGFIPYSFDSIEVASAGERDESTEDVSGVSASRMRVAAAEGDYELFASMTPPWDDSTTQALYQDVRQGLNIR